MANVLLLTSLPNSTLDCRRLCFNASPPSLVRSFNNLDPTTRASKWRLCKLSAMQEPKEISAKEMPLGVDESTAEEYTSQSKLLQEFTNIPSISKAWVFKSRDANSSRAMFSVCQPNLLANKKRTFVLSSHITRKAGDSVDFQWSPFPVEMDGASAIVPSPSGSKLLVVRNKENESPTQLEIWGSCLLEKEIHIPRSTHGSVYIDGWFEGISWDHDETSIAYVAEEPDPIKPSFGASGYKGVDASGNDAGIWKGQGEWEEHWGETYAKKKKPSLFVVKINSGEIRAVKGIPKSLSVGQVVWAPPSPTNCDKYLVFVGWTAENGPSKTPRKLGIKYCYNRPCALYAIPAPFQDAYSGEKANATNDSAAISLTNSLSSAFFPCFSPDGKFLLFLSARSAVDSGVHWATNSLHKMDWPVGGKPQPSASIHDVVPIVMCPEDGCFPGLYCSSFLRNPWLPDGYTMILSSVWGSTEVIISVNILSLEISRVSPCDSGYSWDVLALDGYNILAISSSPVDPQHIKYGFVNQKERTYIWDWLDVESPLPCLSEKVGLLVSSLKFDILKIPVSGPCENLPEGARRPFESIFLSSTCSKGNSDSTQADDTSKPLIVLLHGGPHSVSTTSFSRNVAFLCSLGYNMLIVNYRGSLGFGEEALQSLPGNIGSQDVGDVLTALDYAISHGLADSSKVAVLGGSHGGFLTTHLIGQAPDRFAAAAVRNPVCNLSLMVGTTDIPDWCYVEAGGSEGKDIFSEAPSIKLLGVLYNKSPISHLAKVKTPVIFLVGAQDLRVPVSNGLQYARALREKGGEVKVIIFPEDMHSIDKPQSDFESFLNIGVWFRKYCK